MRIEDLDTARCKPIYLADTFRDLHWIGIDWQEGPCNCQSSGDNSVSSTPSDDSTVEFDTHYADSSRYFQKNRMSIYHVAWQRLYRAGLLYQSPHSRRDVEKALSAPHEGEDEPIFPPHLRPEADVDIDITLEVPPPINWRFRVPDGEVIQFDDVFYGEQRFMCGKDFGDFVVWRGADNIPSYEFAVVVDDLDMQITEVVRGQDLLLSTARQLLLYRALLSAEAGDGSLSRIPRFCHCPLVRDRDGKRMAKRGPESACTLRQLRASGWTPQRIVDELFNHDAVAVLTSEETMLRE